MRVIRWLNKTLVYVILLPIFLICIYAIYDFWCCIKQSESGEYVTIAASADFDWAANSNVIAIISIDDTTIHYPIVQWRDNKYYLARNERNEYSVAGSIFLDYRNSKDFDDNYNIIYGHRMSAGQMFSDIAKFEEGEFFDVHKKATILRADEEIDTEIIAFLRVGVNSSLYRLESRRLRPDNLQDIKSEAIQYRENNEVGRIFVLSTCNKKSKSLRDVLVLKET